MSQPETVPLHGVLKPSGHQRNFLYLPLSIFRHFTNARSIVIKYYGRKDGKPLKEIEIKHKIVNLHRQMQNLDKWMDLHLNELSFNSTIEAHIWTLPRKLRNEIHEKLSDHEKQFTYLPLDILMRATNIGELVLPTIAKGNKAWVNYAIKKIHQQMPIKYGQWYPELANLRFIEPIGNDESNANESENMTTPLATIQPDSKSELEASTPTTTTTATAAVTKSTANASISNEIDQMSVSSRRVLQKRKNNVNSAEDKLPKKIPKPPTDSTLATKSHESQWPCQLALQIIDLSSDDEAPPKEIGKRSDQNHTDVANQRRIVSKPSAPETMPQTTLNQTKSTVGNVPSISNIAANTEANDFDQLENELIQLGEGSFAENNGRQCDVNSPSDFQRKILELNFDDFITQTNIADLVLKEHRKLINDENAILAEEDTRPKLQFYFDFRERIHEWHTNAIKNLKFKKCDCTNDSAEPQSLPTDSNGIESFEPNDFQREIMALSHGAFVNETNIRDILLEDFEKRIVGTQAMAERYVEYGLKYYENERNQPTKWHKSQMNHLKFKKCDCKRNKQFDEKSIATDANETREIGCMTDFEPIESNQSQLKVAALTIHTASQSDIIRITDEPQEDDMPDEAQNTTAIAPQTTPQSEGDIQCSASESNSAPTAAAAATVVVQNEQHQKMMDPQLISPSSSGLNGKTDLPSQKVLKTASNDSASKPQVKTRLDCHYPIELDDDDVICLGEVASAVIDLDLNDSSTHRCDNHATVKTQSSPVENTNKITANNSPAIQDKNSQRNNLLLRNIVDIQPSEESSLTSAPKTQSTLLPSPNEKTG